MKASQVRGQISPSVFNIGMLPIPSEQMGAASSTGHRETTWVPCVLLLTGKASGVVENFVLDKGLIFPIC